MTPSPSDLPSRGRPRQRSSSFTRGNVYYGSRGTTAPTLKIPADVTPVVPPAPMPLQSLIASAKRLTQKKLKGGTFKKTTAQGWQEDAWEMHDLVGEQHFLTTTLANQAAKAPFYVGVLPEGHETTDKPDVAEDEELQSVLDAVGGGRTGFGQLVQRMCVNLWVAGDGWLVGIPKQLLPDYEPEDDEEAERLQEELPSVQELQDPDNDVELSMSDLEWRMMSVSEVTLKRDGIVTLHLGESADEKLDVSPDLLYMIRVWRPHPRRWWEADSPTRASLPVLRELVGLTMHISAQVDSRLAGAGILLVPASAARAMKIAAGIPEDSPEDPFTDALMEAMLTPIGDRANASAVVPLVVTVPDGTSKEFDFLSFAKPLDTEARGLREEAIRRLALGQDAPPEILLGTAGMNHWGAWLVRDDVVTTHIEPPLALIADALTTQYLRPMMAELGYSKEQIKKHVVWYDVDGMIARPNKSADALTLYDRDALSDQALRAASGFDETDAPETSKMDLASQKAFEMVTENPALMANPTLPVLVEQLRALIAGNPVPLPEKVKKGAAAPPVDAQGRPIVTTNPTPQAAGQGAPTAPPRAQPAPTTTSSPSKPQGTGLPPAAPSGTPAQARPGTASVEELEAFARLGAGTPEPGDEELVERAAARAQEVTDEEYARQNGQGGWDLSDKAAQDVIEASFAGGWSAPSDQVYSTIGGPGAIVVLIPKDDDPIHDVSEAKPVHLTLAYLSNDVTVEPVEGLEELKDQVRQAAAMVRTSELTLGVDHVDTLGDSLVAHVLPDRLNELSFLHGDFTDDSTAVGYLDSQRNKYRDQDWQPHVSLQYGLEWDEDGERIDEGESSTWEDVPDTITFDRVGLWVGETHYDFPLRGGDMVESRHPFGLQLPEVTAPRGGVSYTPKDFGDTVIDTFDELQKQHD